MGLLKVQEENDEDSESNLDFPRDSYAYENTRYKKH